MSDTFSMSSVFIHYHDGRSQQPLACFSFPSKLVFLRCELGNHKKLSDMTWQCNLSCMELQTTLQPLRKVKSTFSNCINNLWTVVIQPQTVFRGGKQTLTWKSGISCSSYSFHKRQGTTQTGMSWVTTREALFKEGCKNNTVKIFEWRE